MQLFLTDFVLQGDRITIANLTVLEQMKKVLRMKKGDLMAVQKKVESGKLKVEGGDILRYVVRVDDWDHQCVYGTIVDTIVMPEDLGPSLTMYIAMPNKPDKAELIAQKLAELGVQKIIFWRAERSILREMNEKRVARIQKIIQEAVEQSRGWQLPVLEFELAMDWTVNQQVVIFDIPNDRDNSSLVVTKKQTQDPLISPNTLGSDQDDAIIGVVGPEGGLTDRDYRHFPSHIVSSLGNTILRMETAAIVGAYVLLSSS